MIGKSQIQIPAIPQLGAKGAKLAVLSGWERCYTLCLLSITVSLANNEHLGAHVQYVEEGI